MALGVLSTIDTILTVTEDHKEVSVSVVPPDRPGLVAPARPLAGRHSPASVFFADHAAAGGHLPAGDWPGPAEAHHRYGRCVERQRMAGPRRPAALAAAVVAPASQDHAGPFCVFPALQSSTKRSCRWPLASPARPSPPRCGSSWGSCTRSSSTTVSTTSQVSLPA